MDIPFVTRMIIQASLPGCPADLYAEALNLSAKAQEKMSAIDSPMLSSLEELCPACNIPVPFVNITSALCPNGHTWGELHI
jgi:general transcription factor 3C protein 4